MAKTNTLHIRIEPEIKVSVENTLKQLGLSTKDAVNIFLRQVILTGGLPFDIKLPNPNFETLTAMEEAKTVSKTGKGYTSIDELMKELNS